MNTVLLIGNLGKDPELKQTPTGKSVVTFSVVTKEFANGKETSQWHTIVAWEKRAESVVKYCKKGTQVFIEGKLTYRSWDAKKTGQKRYVTEIVAAKVQTTARGIEQPKPKQQQEEEVYEESYADSADGIPF